jgi:hypothetical protein
MDFDDIEADAGGATATEAPPTLANLGKVRRYLTDEADVHEASETLDPERLALIQGLVALVEGLSERTQWSPATLLKQIGCPARSPADLDEMDEDELADCRAFLELVDRAAQLVDLAIDRRAVAMECSRLLKATGEDAAGLDRILNDGAFSPMQYIALGEISQAAEVARMQSGLLRDSPDEGTNPFDAAPVVHLSLPRIELYVRDKHEQLGDHVIESITAHLKTCDGGCPEAVAFRRARAGD